MSTLHKVCLAALLATVAMIGGCGDSATTIGPAGGTIETAEGVVLTIPAGALEDDTAISVTAVPAADVAAQAPVGAPYAGPIFAFKPHGLTFAKPVTIVLPTTTRANTVLRLENDDDDRWDLAAGGTFGDTSVEFQTDRFSLYAGGAGTDSGSSGAGTFWYKVTATAPDCIPVTGSDAQICGAKAVRRVELVEESTAEILGACSFDSPDGSTTSSGDGRYTFWCERTEPAAGTNEITIQAMQANLPVVHVYWYATDAESPRGILLEEYIRPADGLHESGGATYADPYAKREFDFAGFKQFTFTTTEKDGYDLMKDRALQPLVDAGYNARIFRFDSGASGSTAIVDVYDTYDGRVEMQEHLILKNGWAIKTGADLNRGNTGAYEYSEPLQITATPIFVTDIVTANEPAVSGSIMVMRGWDSVTDGTVLLNGTPIPHTGAGIYTVDDAGISGLGPDSVITITATTGDGKASGNLVLKCPPAIDITAPSAGTVITPNSTLGVQWAPGIPYDHASRASGGAMVGNFACYMHMNDDLLNVLGHGEDFISLTAGQTSQDVEMGECARYLLELAYPGELSLAQEDDGTVRMGYCTVQHRIWLYGPQ